MTRARVLIVLLATLVISGLSSAPVMAKPPEGISPIPACAHGGYRAYMDTAGNVFTSTRQCTQYVLRGGELIPRFGLSVTFTEPDDGQYYVDVTGFGLQPGAFFYVDSDITTPIDLNVVDPSGNIEFAGGFYSCGTFAWLEYFTLDLDGFPIVTRVKTPC